MQMHPPPKMMPVHSIIVTRKEVVCNAQNIGHSLAKYSTAKYRSSFDMVHYAPHMLTKLLIKSYYFKKSNYIHCQK